MAREQQQPFSEVEMQMRLSGHHCSSSLGEYVAVKLAANVTRSLAGSMLQ